MEEVHLPINIPQKPKLDSVFEIKQNEEKYILKIIKKEEQIILSISKQDKLPYKKYIKKMYLKDMKEIHKFFFLFNSLDDFIDYIKASIENKKITIKEENNNQKLFLNINTEYLFKSEIIEIPLLEQKQKSNEFSEEIFKEISLIKQNIKKLEEKINKNNEGPSNLLLEKQNKEIFNLKDDNKKLKENFSFLKEENDKLKEELKALTAIIESQKSQNITLKEEIQNIIKINEGLKADIQEIKESLKKQDTNINSSENININSVIMKNEEFLMIKNAVENRINKKIKGIKKLYQATIDGGEASNFHSKCDNIPNTLTIIKSKGNRRFGGFTSETWETKLCYKNDKNAFLFSLDKKKIYNYKNDNFAIFCYDISGPSFGYNGKGLNIIGISGNPILNKTLYTCESYSKSYNFDGDNNALSEDGKGNHIFAEEYEVYQIMFC